MKFTKKVAPAKAAPISVTEAVKALKAAGFLLIQGSHDNTANQFQTLHLSMEWCPKKGLGVNDTQIVSEFMNAWTGK